MKRNFSDYFIALGVILCSAVLLGALMRARRPADEGRADAGIDFIDVTGIRLHSELRLRGRARGSVSKIRLLTNEERSVSAGGERFNAVRVIVDLFDGVPDIPSDVVASISSDTLLSENSSRSPPARRRLKTRERRAAAGPQWSVDRRSAGFHRAAGEERAGDSRVHSARGRKGLRHARYREGRRGRGAAEISKVADTAQSALISAETLLKRADKLIADNEGAV